MSHQAGNLLMTGVGLVGVVFLAWLIAGRRIVAPPASTTLPQTFVSSRLIPSVFALFAVGLALLFLTIGLDFLFSESDARIGGHWVRLGAGAALLLLSLLCWWGAKRYGTLAALPDVLRLTKDGISVRLRGRSRNWRWDQVADAKVVFAGRDNELLLLLLKEPDPDEVQRLQRLPSWLRRKDPRHVWLGGMWKPNALLGTGCMAVRDAIRAGLAARCQPTTAQLSG